MGKEGGSDMGKDSGQSSGCGKPVERPQIDLTHQSQKGADLGNLETKVIKIDEKR